MILRFPVLAIICFFVFASLFPSAPILVVHGVPVCTVATSVSSSAIRDAPTYVAVVITNDLLNRFDSTTLAGYGAAVNNTMISTFGRLFLADFSIYAADTPNEVGLTLQQLSSYVIYTNDTFRVNLPKEIFQSNVACPTVVFNVTPSAGTIPGPDPTLYEVKINEADTPFVLNVTNDLFASDAVTVQPDPLPHGLILTHSLSSDNRSIVFTVLRDAVFNINATDSVTFTIIFPAAVMQTKIPPLVGASQLQYATVRIAGSEPSVDTYYLTSSGGSVPAEQLWDGVAEVRFHLQGDFWKTNSTLWTTAPTAPSFTVVPSQANGYALLVASGRDPPTITISDRMATMRWPPCPGFAVSQLQTVTYSNWGGLTLGGVGLIDFSFAIRPATASAISVNFTGSVFDNPIDELQVRRDGFSFSISLFHDIFSTAITSSTMMDLFQTTVNLNLSLSNVQYVLNDTTILTVIIPPQPTFNIAVREEIRLAMTPSLLASRSTIVAVKMLYIRTVPTPRCNLIQPYDITALRIRSEISRFSIEVYNDTFCNLEKMYTDVLPFSYSTLGVLQVNMTLATSNATVLQFEIAKDVTYALSSPDFWTIVMSRTVFCSREVCSPILPAVEPNPASSLTLPVRPSPGTLLATFGTFTEVRFRTQSLQVNLTLDGDKFVNSIFRPLFTVISSSSLDGARGFVASIQSSCQAARDTLKQNVALLTCLPNSTYDISATEIIQVVITRNLVETNVQPINNATLLTIHPVQGVITASVGQVTNLTEAQIIAGGFSMSFSLTNERWNASKETVVRSMRSSWPPITTTGSYSTVAYLSSFLPAASLYISPLQDTLIVTFQPLPQYDITRQEVFWFLLTSSAIAGSVDPINNNFTFVVTPSEGVAIATGSALFFGVSTLVTTSITLVIELRNELWLTTASYSEAELCPMSSACTVVVDGSLRVLTIVVDANPDFYLTKNTSYPIVLRGSYVASGKAPTLLQNASRYVVYVTSGLLTWSGPTALFESTVRSGTAGTFFINMRGDLFRSSRATLSSLQRSVVCRNLPSTTSLASQVALEGASAKFAFCGRLKSLLVVENIQILQGSRVAQLTLQSDPLFDVAVPQEVTLALDGEATSSFIPPTNTFTFLIYPTNGTIRVSGIGGELLPTTRATSRDIQGLTRRDLRVSVTLTGDVFQQNASIVMAAIRSNLIVTNVKGAAIVSSSGFYGLRSQLLDNNAATVSADGSTVTFSITPSSSYSILTTEVVRISFANGMGILSGLQPQPAAVGADSFWIVAAAGIVALNPSVILASTLQKATFAEPFVLSLVITGGAWNQSFVQVANNMLLSIASRSSRFDEPLGFEFHRALFLSIVGDQGATINGSSLVVRFVGSSTYNIRREERVQFAMTTPWTTAGLPMVPSEYSLRIVPDPISIEVIIETLTLDVDAFQKAVERELGVSHGRVWIQQHELAPQLPQSSTRRFYRVVMRIVSVSGASAEERLHLGVSYVPSDALLSQTFVSMGEVAWMHMYPLTRYAHYVSNEAPYWIWKYLLTGELPEPPSKGLQLTILEIFAMVAGSVLVLLAAFLYWRYRKRLREQGGLFRLAERKAKVQAIAAERDDLAEDAKLFVGQTEGGLNLASEAELAEVRDLEAAEEMFQPIPSRQYRVEEELGNPTASEGSQQPTHLTKLHAMMQREFAAMNAAELEREIPLSLYSGQRERPPMNTYVEPVVDIDQFLVEGGYLPTVAEREARATRLRVRELRERERAEKGLTAGVAAAAAAPGTLMYRPRTVEEQQRQHQEEMDDLLNEDPFSCAVSPPWSKAPERHMFLPHRWEDRDL